MRRILTVAGSLRLTVPVLIALGVGVVIAYRSEVRTTWALVVPMLLLAINLAAALATNPRFRRQTPLVVFHLALITLLLLIAAGRLTYLKGHLGLVEGESFAGQLRGFDAGPLHPWRLDEVQFINDGFEIDYAPGPRRGQTRNRVRWVDDRGVLRSAVVGDQVPFVARGYRFYTSFNKGFAPVFIWLPDDGGMPQRGAVQLPAYPGFEFGQALQWNLPDPHRTEVWVLLDFDEVILEPEQPSGFRTPDEHMLILRIGDQRMELRPGDVHRMRGGTLVYEGLKTWMGYSVFYDPTLPWLLAVCLMAVGSLAWHYRSKYLSKPWLAEESAIRVNQTNGH